MVKHNLGHWSAIEHKAGRRRALFPSPSSPQHSLGMMEMAMGNLSSANQPWHSWLAKMELLGAKQRHSSLWTHHF